MADGREHDGTPLLDEWIAEIGAEQVVDAVKDAARAIREGHAPGFTEKSALLAHIGRLASE